MADREFRVDLGEAPRRSILFNIAWSTFHTLLSKVLTVTVVATSVGGGVVIAHAGGAFGDMGSGRQAGQFGQRGAQSRSFGQQRSFAGGGRGGRR